MSFKAVLLAAVLLATSGLNLVSAQWELPLDGDWRITTLVADGAALPSAALESSVASIKDGLVTFRLSQSSVLEDVGIRLEFVKDGLDAFDVNDKDESSGEPMKGTWALTPTTFQFCFSTDRDANRPDLRAGDGLFYIELQRIKNQ